MCYYPFQSLLLIFRNQSYVSNQFFQFKSPPTPRKIPPTITSLHTDTPTDIVPLTHIHTNTHIHIYRHPAIHLQAQINQPLNTLTHTHTHPHTFHIYKITYTWTYQYPNTLSYRVAWKAYQMIHTHPPTPTHWNPPTPKHTLLPSNLKSLPNDRTHTQIHSRTHIHTLQSTTFCHTRNI